MVTEWSFQSEKTYQDPFNEVELDVIFTGPQGAEQRVPAFWAGDNIWRVRFAEQNPGTYCYTTVCSDTANTDLHGLSGEVKVLPYEGDNPLYKHGPIQVAADRRHFEHTDRTPFLWLGDTWYMGLCNRLDWPKSFQSLVIDRVEKGFNTAMIVAGLYPDMGPFDPRGANEAGFPWEEENTRINPSYFDMADRRITYMVDSGIVPCIFGCWGFHLEFMGAEKIKKHWRYLVARYGAYPVAWCVAGEAVMPYYLSKYFNDRESYEPGARHDWTEITRYVRELDTYQRPITIHPTIYRYDMVEDLNLLDMLMLQTGHGSHQSIHTTVKVLQETMKRAPEMPVMIGEACYEGICEGNREEIQRYIFWASILSGAAGHIYGADGIWQVNRKDEQFGPSPTGAAWGESFFEDACQFKGSAHLGLAKKFLERYSWEHIEPHQEWLEIGANSGIYTEEVQKYLIPYAAGIPGKLRLIYLGVWMAQLDKVKGIEPGVKYRAFLFNTSSGREYNLGEVVPDSDWNWPVPQQPIYRDWVLVLEEDDLR